MRTRLLMSFITNCLNISGRITKLINDMKLKKHIMAITALLLCIILPLQAQDITGKWKCPKGYLNSLGLQYSEMNGYFQFKKNGKFKIYIKGYKTISKPSSDYVSPGGKWVRESARLRYIIIKVKGRYTVKNDSISTSLGHKGVYCYVDPGRDAPNSDAGASESRTRWNEYLEDAYNKAVYKAKTQETMVKKELSHVWIWHKVPLTLAKDSLSIKGKVELER